MKNVSIKKYLTAGIVAIALFSTGTGILPVNQHAYAAASTTEKIISTGMKYLGTPYEFGSNRSTTKTFDCSDFTKHIFKVAAGITIPSTSAAQAAYVKKKSTIKTNWTSLKRGDLMFFMSYRGTGSASYAKLSKSKQTVTHVGVYLGNGKMINTFSKESGGVRIDSIDNKQWEYRFLFGGSAL
ncbi:C40 family peptidase [Paenibacillus sinopodophylli]|uniref:C40 family peptidase n=1 Tax=Paenibacillus sinopodophylli TaxID=1837342 RepID=UPI00110CBAF0|nr:C40 family peptidase [Paenibacillus sinopodophylli]